MGKTQTSGQGFFDLTGKRFGRITVLRRGPNANYKPHVRWHVRCDCGNESLVDGRNLRRRHTKSCGCLAREHMTWHEKFMAAVPRLTPEQRQQSALHYLYQTQKHKAKRRKIKWDIPRDLFVKLVQNPCVYCGSTPSNRCTIFGREILWSGLDRVDSSVGYLAANVVPACCRCNVAKHSMSLTEFREWITRVYRHQNQNQPV